MISDPANGYGAAPAEPSGRSPPLLEDLRIFDFESASRAVLQFLRSRLGFDLWMVTREKGKQGVILQTEDHGYGVTAGTVFRWDDSYCSRMVKGEGPNIAPESALVPAYAAAAVNSHVQIGAYVGVPLRLKDGSTFGTLCGFHPEPQPQSIVSEQPLMELLAGLLGCILETELRAEAEARRGEHAQTEAETDALTGTYNRRGWDRLLAAEEGRCARYGHSACVVSVDLDELKRVNDSLGHSAGDALLRRTGEALRSAARTVDSVARVGGDEFAVLAVECDVEFAQAFAERLRRALEDQDVKASVGLALRDPAKGLPLAWEEADRRMYDEKRSRRS
jgi:diguanylate cyclase